MNVDLILMPDDDILEFKKKIQYAFQKGFEDVYGKTNVLPEKERHATACLFFFNEIRLTANEIASL